MYAACSGCVVGVVVGKIWRIVPCVYKIYTLGRFQFHGLLRKNLFAFVFGGKGGGNIVRERCVFLVS